MMVIGVKIPREKDEENREWKITPAEKIHNPGSAVSRWAAVAERGMVLTRGSGKNPSLNFAEKNVLSN